MSHDPENQARQPAGDEPAPRWSEYELEVARGRDLLGLSNAHLDPDLRVLATLLNRIEAEDATESPAVVDVQQDSSPGKRRTPPRWPIVTAAAAVLAVVVVLAQGIWRAPSASATPAPLTYELAQPERLHEAPLATKQLDALAGLAANHGPPQPSSSAQTQYTESFGWYLSIDNEAWSAGILPMWSQLWIGPDGAALSKQTTSPLVRPDGSLDTEFERETPELMVDRFEPGSLSEPFVELPAEPDAVLATLRSTTCHNRGGIDSCLLDEVASLANQHVLSGTDLSRIWSALASEEGVRFLGSVTDRLGRDAVALTAPETRTPSDVHYVVLLVSPEDGGYLGVEKVSIENELLDLTEPAVTEFTTIVTSKLVQNLGDEA